MKQTNGISNTLLQALIVIILAIAVGVILYMKHQERSVEPIILKPGDEMIGNGFDPGQRAIPLLLDLGATKCIPCKMMAPILEELREEYQGRFDVVFIDVWENRKAIGQYNIRVIPTQIFFNAEGKELFRHQGFYSKEDILNKWKNLGIDITKDSNTKG